MPHSRLMTSGHNFTCDLKIIICSYCNHNKKRKLLLFLSIKIDTSSIQYFFLWSQISGYVSSMHGLPWFYAATISIFKTIFSAIQNPLPWLHYIGSIIQHWAQNQNSKCMCFVKLIMLSLNLTAQKDTLFTTW